MEDTRVRKRKQPRRRKVAECLSTDEESEGPRPLEPPEIKQWHNLDQRAHDGGILAQNSKEMKILLVSVLVFFLVMSLLYIAMDAENGRLRKENETLKVKFGDQQNETNACKILRASQNCEAKFCGKNVESTRKELQEKNQEIERLEKTLKYKDEEMKGLEITVETMKVEFETKESAKTQSYERDLENCQGKIKNCERALEEQKKVTKEYEERYSKWYHMYNEEQKRYSECKHTALHTDEKLKKAESENKSQGPSKEIGLGPIVIIIIIGSIFVTCCGSRGKKY